MCNVMDVVAICFSVLHINFVCIISAMRDLVHDVDTVLHIC